MAIGPDYSVRPYADKYARDETPVSESDLRSIQKMADNVDSKKWGIDTRYSISSSMRLMDEVIKDTLGRQDEVEGQFQDVIDNTTDKDVISAPEIIAARNGEPNLKARLDKEKNEVTTQLAHNETNLNERGINVSSFGVVGDGLTDDTSALQSAIDYATEKGVNLIANDSQIIAVRGVSINGYIQLVGSFNLVAYELNQSHVLEINHRMKTIGSLTVNGKNMSLYGIVGNDFGRSSFDNIVVNRNKIWGFQFNPVGNNNMVSVDYINCVSNGLRHSTELTKISETSNVNSSLGGYGTYELKTPLESIYVKEHAFYYLIYKGEAYKIKEFTNTTIEVLNLSTVEGEVVTVDLIIGGGINLTKHGDNNIGSFGNLDLSANRGIGIHSAALFAPQMNNISMQANSIGIGCVDFMYNVAILKPYFEDNIIDIAYWGWLDGFMTNSIPAGMPNIQKVNNRIRAGGIKGGSIDFKIFNKQGFGLTTDIRPYVNPGEITLTPGFVYGFQKNTGTWDFVIDNSQKFDTLNQYVTLVNLSHNPIGPFDINISLENENGQTIEGEQNYQTKILGRKGVLQIWKVADDWKVNLIQPNEIMYTSVTSISTPPPKIGLFAVVNGVGYMSTGTTSSDDWKQITS